MCFLTPFGMTHVAHTPVLLQESLNLLQLKPGMTVVDATLGLGGHSEAILKTIGPKGHLIAFEQDERNLKEAKKRLKKYEKQITYIHENFENLSQHFSPKTPIDAILFDLGLSSPHLDDPERGFSFQKDGPLDMRFDQRNSLTAEKVVNTYSEKALADVIYHYGEEGRSRLIAQAIVLARKKERITHTTQLAHIIASTIKSRPGLHPATLTFQALRIYINRELEVLESALKQGVEHLRAGGRIGVISYHSLEDRITKQIFKHFTQTCICPKEMPLCQCNFKKKLYISTRKPIIPKSIEVNLNPRARSAKLRGAERI